MEEGWFDYVQACHSSKWMGVCALSETVTSRPEHYRSGFFMQ